MPRPPTVGPLPHPAPATPRCHASAGQAPLRRSGDPNLSDRCYEICIRQAVPLPARSSQLRTSEYSVSSSYLLQPWSAAAMIEKYVKSMTTPNTLTSVRSNCNVVISPFYDEQARQILFAALFSSGHLASWLLSLKAINIHTVAMVRQ